MTTKIFKKQIDSGVLISALIILILCISCAYHYIDFKYQSDNVKMNENYIKNQYKEIRWESVKSIISVVNREGELHSNLVAYLLRRNIESKYPDMNVLKQKLETGHYSSEPFSSLIFETVNNNSFMGKASSRNGILISCDDRILYNLIIDNDRFDVSWAEFIDSNYNKKLASNTFEAIKRRSSKLKVLEPHEPSTPKETSAHKIIEYSSIEELKDIYMEEGLAGLSAYTLITPYYLTDSGDIFGETDYDINTGERVRNHKIIVMTYISLYDVIQNYHNQRFDNLEKLENEALEKNLKELNSLYYSSIKSMLFHIACIILILGIVKYYNMKSKKE